MKCRNIDKNDNSAIFFGGKLTWPRKILFEIWCDGFDRHVTRELYLDWTNQTETYEITDVQFIIAGDEDYPVYTDPFDVVLLGSNRNDEHVYWDKNIYNLFYINYIESSVDIDRCILHFVDDNDRTYFSYETTIEPAEGVYPSWVNEVQIFLPKNNKAQLNYVEDAEAVKCALVQKLSIFKNELWFAKNYGLPLFEKSTRGIFDAYIAMTISEQYGVKEILSFNSSVNKNEYHISFEVNSIYGQLSIDM